MKSTWCGMWSAAVAFLLTSFNNLRNLKIVGCFSFLFFVVKISLERDSSGPQGRRGRGGVWVLLHKTSMASRLKCGQLVHVPAWWRFIIVAAGFCMWSGFNTTITQFSSIAPNTFCELWCFRRKGLLICERPPGTWRWHLWFRVTWLWGRRHNYSERRN